MRVVQPQKENLSGGHMKTTGNTVLITGGATGIGFALAEAFHKADNKVIICGRRESRLQAAASKLPGVQVKVCDQSNGQAREEFCEWILANFPDLNILINNAGVQKMINLKDGTRELTAGDNEIATNFEAPVYLSARFGPHLMKQKEAAIINVSSGLGYIPIAAMPVYCATKAGIHSFTVSLRYQLKDTTIKVFEIVPPRVNTDLGGGDEEGIPPEEVADATMKALQNNEYNIIVGEAEGLVESAKTSFEQAFNNINQW